MLRLQAPSVVSTPSTQRTTAIADPLPVLLLRHGHVNMGDLDALYEDRRFELFVTNRLTPDWMSFAQRVAGTIVVTDADPMSALLYAVTGGVKGTIVLMFGKRYGVECRDFIAAGAAACITTPITTSDLDRIVPVLTANATLTRVDKTLGLLLDPITQTVRYREQCVRLTQREFAVLQCLSSYQGRPVAAHKVVTYVWGDRVSSDGSRNLLDVYVFQLRKKLERVGLRGVITTVRGLGYALTQVSTAFSVLAVSA